jgi:hypothetical protein
MFVMVVEMLGQNSALNLALGQCAEDVARSRIAKDHLDQIAFDNQIAGQRPDNA